MKKILESTNLTEVHLIASFLRSNGLEISIVNELQAGNLGIPHRAIPAAAQIWILNNQQFEQALALIRDYQHDQSQLANGPDWQCPKCTEMCPSTFEACWQCGTLRPGL